MNQIEVKYFAEYNLPMMFSVSTPLIYLQKRNWGTVSPKQWDAESESKCLIKCEKRSLIALSSCSETKPDSGWVASDQVALFWSPGLDRPTNHTEIWNLGQTGPQACRSLLPKCCLFHLAYFTLYSRIKWVELKSFFWDFRREQRKYLEPRRLPEQLLKHELSSTYTLV